MNKKLLWPFALTTLAMMLNGCGGGSSTINEDPTSGSGSSNANGSCAASSDDCLQFSLDYPVAGLNFTCSSVANQSFVTFCCCQYLLQSAFACTFCQRFRGR